MKRFIPAVFAVLIMPSAGWAQGSLSAPGAPAPTMRTLEQIEPRIPISSLPFNITQRGSYYLTANLQSGAGTNGISISADNVTIDLNGFVLRGLPGSLDGITVTGFDFENITVRNGTVREWGEAGIDLLNADNVLIYNIHAYTNGQSGTFDGIRGGSNCRIHDCLASGNSGNGIYGFLNGVISDCAAGGNGQDGIYGNSGMLVKDNAVMFNRNDGIQVSSDSLVINNNARANGFEGDGAGIHVNGRGSRIEGNNVTENDRGIDVDLGDNLVIRNTADGNTTDYDLAAGVAYGQIITVTGVFTNSDPTANFSY